MAAPPGPTTVRGAAVDAIRTFTPGYFALVMGTGIVSIGMIDHVRWLSLLLLWIAGIALVVLVVILLLRLLFFRSNVLGDFTNPQRGFGFFTVVAGLNVLGTRLHFAGFERVALVMLLVGFVLFLLFGHLLTWKSLIGKPERPAIKDANGTWFIWAVASQSVAVLAAKVEPTLTVGRREVALLAVFCWSVGLFLYVGLGAFVAQRLLLYPLKPPELNPPYWVSMGASAIAVVAGSNIVAMADAPVLQAAKGMISGSTIVFWAFGTWLIPGLIASGWWKYVKHREPLRYEATFWSMIFPLGMYGVASFNLGTVEKLPIVEVIGRVQHWIAFVAWLMVFVAMWVHLARSLIVQPRRRAAAAARGPV